MPRNASGTYTLPSGNPVVSGTLIDATWANNTLSDLGNEVTDSLSRSGEGAMLAPLRITDGVQATPSIGFSNEPSSGLYRAGTNEWWAVAAGVQNLRFTNTGLTTRAAAGAVGTPSLAAFNDVDTGIYFPGANEIGIATGGVLRLSIDSAGTATFTANPVLSAGTANGVLYLNGSKVATSGSGLVFDGTNLGVGVSPSYRLDILGAGATAALRINNATAGKSAMLVQSNGSTAGILGLTGFIKGDSSTNLGLFAENGFDIRFYTNGSPTERAVIDSSGNLGLGVTPSTSWFASSKAIQIGIAGAPYMGLVQQTTTTCDGYMLWGARLSGDRAFQYTSSGDAVCAYRQNAGTHNWFTAASGTAGNTISFTQAMTLDASGNLGVGTTSPDARLQVTHDNAETSQFNIGASILHLTNTNTTNNNWAQIFFTDSDGGAAAATFGAQYTDHTNDYANLSFATRGSSGLAERARITSGGAWVVGDTSAYAVAIALAKSTAAGTSVYNSWNSDTSGTRFHFEFRDGAGATSRGSITTDGTNTAYNTSSDRRLKENIAPSAEAGSVIDGIEVVEFDWKSGSHTRFGMIAQDLNVVAPEAVTAGDDGEEIEKSWSVDYSKLVPMLVKEIQSLRARVAALESA